MPCPTSTLPVKAVTAPSTATWIHAPPVGAHMPGAASGGGATTTSPSPSTSNSVALAGRRPGPRARGRPRDERRPRHRPDGAGSATGRRGARPPAGWRRRCAGTRSSGTCWAPSTSRSRRRSDRASTSSSAVAATTMPGVQKPHCIAPPSTNARCTGCICRRGASPSTVVTDRPTTSAIGTTQARASAPSISTLHAPHAASPQPYLVPVSPRSSRSQPNRWRPATSPARRSTPLTTTESSGGGSGIGGDHCDEGVLHGGRLPRDRAQLQPLELTAQLGLLGSLPGDRDVHPRAVQRGLGPAAPSGSRTPPSRARRRSWRW